MTCASASRQCCWYLNVDYVAKLLEVCVELRNRVQLLRNAGHANRVGLRLRRPGPSVAVVALIPPALKPVEATTASLVVAVMRVIRGSVAPEVGRVGDRTLRLGAEHPLVLVGRSLVVSAPSSAAHSTHAARRVRLAAGCGHQPVTAVVGHLMRRQHRDRRQRKNACVRNVRCVNHRSYQARGDKPCEHTWWW
jgi:hypothetical protein